MKYDLVEINKQLNLHKFDTRSNIEQLLPKKLTCNDYHELYKLFYDSNKSYLYGNKSLLRSMLINKVQDLQNHYILRYSGIKEWSDMDWEEKRIVIDLVEVSLEEKKQLIANSQYSKNIINWLKYKIQYD